MLEFDFRDTRDTLHTIATICRRRPEQVVEFVEGNMLRRLSVYAYCLQDADAYEEVSRYINLDELRDDVNHYKKSEDLVEKCKIIIREDAENERIYERSFSVISEDGKLRVRDSAEQIQAESSSTEDGTIPIKSGD